MNANPSFSTRWRKVGMRLGIRLSESYAAFSNTVRIARGDYEGLEAIEQFRYQIYVLEQGKILPGVDHSCRRVRDVHDRAAYHFTAHDIGGALIGYARLHLNDQLPPGTLERLGLTKFAWQYDRTFGYVSNLMVARTYRGAGIAVQLMRSIGDFGQSPPQHGELAFCHCRPGLAPLYKHLGFRSFGDSYTDPNVGSQVPMYLIGGDLDHFKVCRSPLASMGLKYRLTSERKRYLLSLIPPTSPSHELLS